MAGLFANWEVDLWGRVRAEREAGRQQLAASLADTEFARQSIAALVAKSWVLAIEARLQRAVAAEIVRASEQTVELARVRARVGKGDEADTTLAQASLESARDAARQLALAQEQALRALETLVGRYPAAQVEVAAALPAAPAPVPAGLPSELLERRPDVIAAERRVAAAFYRVSEARAARLPRLALTAAATGVSSSSIFMLQQDRQNPVYGLGVNLTAPLFTGYALEAQVDIRTAEQRLAVAQYGQVAQRAFAEAEGALSAGLAAEERTAILTRSVASQTRALELAQVRYRVGSGDLRAVLQQQVAVFGGRSAELRVRSEHLIQRVNLHLALGGSFDQRPGESPRGAVDDAALRFVATRPAPKGATAGGGN
jgi:NodT family efflux transporter outer membrane factor (OMF) lipoprotein